MRRSFLPSSSSCSTHICAEVSEEDSSFQVPRLATGPGLTIIPAAQLCKGQTQQRPPPSVVQDQGSASAICGFLGTCVDTQHWPDQSPNSEEFSFLARVALVSGKKIPEGTPQGGISGHLVSCYTSLKESQIYKYSFQFYTYYVVWAGRTSLLHPTFQLPVSDLLLQSLVQLQLLFTHPWGWGAH